jgi:hypothetical protein
MPLELEDRAYSPDWWMVRPVPAARKHVRSINSVVTATKEKLDRRARILEAAHTMQHNAARHSLLPVVLGVLGTCLFVCKHLNFNIMSGRC